MSGLTALMNNAIALPLASAGQQKLTRGIFFFFGGGGGAYSTYSEKGIC